MENSNRIAELFKVFFRLGCLAFGGPAAHIAMMEAEVVTKRKWMTSEEFLDMVSTTNLIPGPNSTEMTMHCGYHHGGKLGLFVAGFAFIFPATVITGVIAWVYALYGDLPNIEPVIEAIQPAVLAIIAGAVLKLGKKAIQSTAQIILSIVVLVAAILGYNEILLLLGAGLLGMLLAANGKNNMKMIFPLTLPSISLVGTKAIGSTSIFWSFLKVGAVLYGSGYVLFAYLDAELVEKGWMTRQVLLDAIAAGQMTPGPVLSTSTFIGFQLGGLSGSLLATLGIFLPSFLFVLLLHPWIKKMRQSTILGGFLDSVNPAAVAIMLAVLVIMTKETVVNVESAIIAAISALIVFKFKKISVLYVILAAGVYGYIQQFI